MKQFDRVQVIKGAFRWLEGVVMESNSQEHWCKVYIGDELVTLDHCEVDVIHKRLTEKVKKKKVIDWEQRTFDLAKDILIHSNIHEFVEAISLAKGFIETFKKEVI